jgi:heme/copper-type cytochrome/quinol oxidase subunit 1
MTVSFMGLTYALLPALGLAVPAAVQIRRQTACYAWGNLLMMAGLAGAGLMGAPRKAAGNISLDFSVETAARLLMGLGGTLAMIGIIGFFILTVRALRQVRRDPAPLGCAVGQ